jgi:hypothetical protein
MKYAWSTLDLSLQVQGHQISFSVEMLEKEYCNMI